MDSSTVLDVDRLTLDHGDSRAVESLGLEVRSGEPYALLGTDDAGMTSTLEVTEGHRAPTFGTVRILGEDPRYRRRIIGTNGSRRMPFRCASIGVAERHTP